MFTRPRDQSAIGTATNHDGAIPVYCNGYCRTATKESMRNKYVLVVCDYATRFPEAFSGSSCFARAA